MHRLKAEIVEIFSSIQGEGIFLGAKQIFVRFKDCNMKCAFCDEPRDSRPTEYTPLELISEVKFLELSKGPHHSVSLTGGEPLLYSDFLKSFLKSLKKEKFKSYLETNGTLPERLRDIIEFVDIISMDMKLPSSTHERSFWHEHSEFLKIAVKKKVFVKAVVTAETGKDDIEKAIALMKRVKDTIPFILQPATPVTPKDRLINKEKLLSFVEIGRRHNLDMIRVIPQTHKILGIK